MTLKLPLARSAINRDYLARQRPELFDELWADSLTRVLVLHKGKVLLRGNAEPELRLLAVDAVGSATLRAYLGRTTSAVGDEPAGTPVVLAVVGDNSANQIESDVNAWHNLRRTGAGLNDRDAGLYAQALSLANWHETHQHCPRCGTPTVIEQGGWVRRCFKDDQEIYPRTDPAVIVSVIDDQDRILLGSQGSWEENRWSILAGFVEPGESLPAAVAREIFEESGVHVAEPTYLGSQAWPFPYSLMLGFTARVDESKPSSGLVPDGIEIEKLRWFTREEISSEDIILPGRLSIARAIIEHWYGSEISDK